MPFLVSLLCLLRHPTQAFNATGRANVVRRDVLGPSLPCMPICKTISICFPERVAVMMQESAIALMLRGVASFAAFLGLLQEKAQVLLDSELVLCTLSSSGGDLLRLAQHLAQRGAGGQHANSSTTLFDALIIDEAAQAVEPAALIPMQLLRPNSKVYCHHSTGMPYQGMKSTADL